MTSGALTVIERGGFRLEYQRGNDGSMEKTTGVASIANLPLLKCLSHSTIASNKDRMKEGQKLSCF